MIKLYLLSAKANHLKRLAFFITGGFGMLDKKATNSMLQMVI